MNKTLLVLTFCISFIIFFRVWPPENNTAKAFHSSTDLQFFDTHLKITTPLDSGEYFLYPSECKGCHGYDSAGMANIDPNGMDVNLYDDWETSMMGLSAVDPFWKAKVSHEILTNPAHANELQTLCTSCHAPMGHYTAFYKGQPHYTLDDLATDSLGQAGVACGGCHAIKDSSALGQLFTGQIPYDTTRKEYGPFTAPFAGPMQLYVGISPTYSNHVSEARFCSPCHTLISNTVDLSGNPTGGTFAEQATYQEYKNSIYPGIDTTCQTCHMPKLEDPIKIANGYLALAPRSPFNLHQFAGANSFMVKLIKANKSSLGVSAPDANFDSTLVAINNQLKLNTLDVKTNVAAVSSDTAVIDVTLTNKAGHKFPSGYPARRAVVQFVVTKSNGDTLFASGLFDNNFEVTNISLPFEQHHNNINNQNQSQIYEMVMADVNGNRTTVLERAANSLKDNRIPPQGFTTSHVSYDTCKIVGNATTDADFNLNGSIQGTGSDIVHYHIPMNGYNGIINVSASVYYQTLPPFFLSEMSTFSSAYIDTFLTMFANADRSPVLIARDTLQNIVIPLTVNDTKQKQNITIAPNPTTTGIVYISSGIDPIKEIEVYNLQGNKESIAFTNTNNAYQVTLPNHKGVYFLVIKTAKGKWVKKVLYL